MPYLFSHVKQWFMLQVELFLDTMPLTASNFIDLAKTGYYDGLTFHRVIPK
jgi:cyclophilin family peptidyl-prolyl cis-trans isomerase